MSPITKPPVLDDLDYPTSDGRPMAETDWHRILMVALIDTLIEFFKAVPRVYVSGNLLVFYEPGDKRKHLAPDVFVVRGASKRKRPNYLIWREGKPPQVVIELTSSTTRKEDITKKFGLYRDVLKVKEYFLFDPFEDYLDPPMQGYRLHKGLYVPIEPADGRLPSRVLGLHLERAGRDLRLWDPATGQRLLTPQEARQQAEEAARQAEEAARQAEKAARHAEETTRQAEEAARQAEEAARQAQAERDREAESRQRAEAENERLRREIEKLRRRSRKP